MKKELLFLNPQRFKCPEINEIAILAFLSGLPKPEGIWEGGLGFINRTLFHMLESRQQFTFLNKDNSK